MTDKRDLTTGVIWKKLILFFLPIAAGTLFQQLYNSVDAIIVGRFVGTAALAAVGGTPTPITNLVIGFFVSLASGAGVIIAQSYGAKDNARVSKGIHTAMTFAFFAGVLLSVVIYLYAPRILVVLNTPEDILADSILYTRIYFAGSIFLLIFNMASGVLRALGDSRNPFLFLIISCGSNILLDCLFVIVFHWGVAGVAWATFIASGISAVLSVICLMTARDSFRLSIRKLGIDWKLLGSMMKVGIPTALQSAMFGVSNMVLQIGVNSLGTTVVASWTLSTKLDAIYWATSESFGNAIMNFDAQNYGAKKYDRIHACTKTALKVGIIGSIVGSTLILGFARPLLHIFTTDMDVIEIAQQIIVCYMPYYFIWAILTVISAALRGLGDAVSPTVITGIGVCLLRILWLIIVFPLFPTHTGIAYCYLVSWTITSIALIIYYEKKWKPRLIEK